MEDRAFKLIICEVEPVEQAIEAHGQLERVIERPS
jgi:hypothetical protein